MAFYNACRFTKYTELSVHDEALLYVSNPATYFEQLMNGMANDMFIGQLQRYMTHARVSHVLQNHGFRNEQNRIIPVVPQAEKNLFASGFNMWRDSTDMHVLSHQNDRHFANDTGHLIANVRFPGNIASVYRRPTKYARIAYEVDTTGNITRFKTLFPQYAPSLRPTDFNNNINHEYYHELEYVSYGCMCSFHTHVRAIPYHQARAWQLVRLF